MQLEYQLLCLYVLTNYCTEACLHHFASVNGLAVILRWLKLGVDVDCLSLLSGVLGFLSVLPMDELIITFIKTNKIGGKINKLLKHSDVDIIRGAQKAKDCIQEKVVVFGSKSVRPSGSGAASKDVTASSQSLPGVVVDIDRYLRTVKMEVAKPTPPVVEVPVEPKVAPVKTVTVAPKVEVEVVEPAKSSPARINFAQALSVVREDSFKDAPATASGLSTPSSDLTRADYSSLVSEKKPKPFGSGVLSQVSASAGTGTDAGDGSDNEDDSVISFTGFNKFKRNTVSMGASLTQKLLSSESTVPALAPAHCRTAVPGKSILKKTVPVGAENMAESTNALDAALGSSPVGLKVAVGTGRSIFWADHGAKGVDGPLSAAAKSTPSSSGAGAASPAVAGELTQVYTYEIDTLFRRKIAGYQSTKEREKTERLKMKEDAKKKFIMIAELTPAEWERPKVLLLPSLTDEATDAWESAFAIPETDSDCKMKEDIRLKTVLEERYYSGKPTPMDPSRPLGPNSLKGPEHSQELVEIPFDILTAGGEQGVVPPPEPTPAALPAAAVGSDEVADDLSAMMEQLPELIRNLDSSILQHLITHEDDLMLLLNEDDGSVDEEKVRQYVAAFHAQRGGPPPPTGSYGGRMDILPAYASGAMPPQVPPASGYGAGSNYNNNGGQKRERELCSYFNTAAGCMRGDDCRYMHVLGAPSKRQRR